MSNYYTVHDDDNNRVGMAPHKNSKASIFSFDIIPLPKKILNIKNYVITNAEEILFTIVLFVGSGV